ncbi:MAG: glycosyltransferase family 4 protein [Alphaproteobacteria bacterium]|nr:glycosyltransferase family 4 protein [Alphaproteobacteria bacterium]
MDKKPTILQLTPALHQGGVERGTVEMANFLASEGWGSLVASAGGSMKRDLNEDVLHLNVSMKRKTPLEILKAYLALTAYLKENPVDLIHARSRIPAWVAYFVSCRTGIPYLTTYHGTYGMQNMFKKFYNSAMVRGKHVIAISKFIEAHVKTYFPKHPDMSLAYRGFDVSRFTESDDIRRVVKRLRAENDFHVGVPILMLPGRLTRWKGQADFIKALADMKDLDWFAILAGGAEERQEGYLSELKDMAKAYGISERIVFTGNVENIVPYYALSDIIVCPSNKPEAFGRVPVEAGSMAKPIVATAHGGALETIKDGETGFHFAVGDTSGMAKILRSLIENDSLCKELGENGKAFVEKTFTLKNMCSAELSAYKQVLKVYK